MRSGLWGVARSHSRLLGISCFISAAVLTTDVCLRKAAPFAGGIDRIPRRTRWYRTHLLDHKAGFSYAPAAGQPSEHVPKSTAAPLHLFSQTR